ncbi:MFS transporter [Nocardioides bruguierae]|uniref:MFS transporter n=1 Tax=Nocardioides bruguierae TaxID=2945102 RepID=A0A9X2IFA4_9ACTN|nr:MFS transporter [Nocardioides bruguierae]MCM0620888.1 MFS transporter [Nocardioides bruguierae]
MSLTDQTAGGTPTGAARSEVGAPGAREWAAVGALALAIFSLVTSEFLPASLLPAMADDFGVSEGVAGQVVTATALVGMLAGPGITLLFPRTDRRVLLLGLLAVAVLANVLTAVAPAYAVVVVARLLLGAAIAGSWALAIGVCARLVSAARLGRAMSIVNLGLSASLVLSVPLGALLSSAAGWRPVFWGVAALGLVALAAIAVLVPSVPASPGAGAAALLGTLRSPVLLLGLAGVGLLVAGHFGSYTFVRPAIDAVGGMNTGLVALALVLYGAGGLLGNAAVGVVIDRRLPLLLLVVPGVICAAVVLLAVAGALGTGSVPLALVAVAVWGLGFGGIATSTQTLTARAEPTRIESAGGLYVAVFQLAIALGTALGGLLLDAAGVTPLLVASGVVVVLGGLLMHATRHRLA